VEEPEPPAGDANPRRRWHPHLSRAGKWFAGTVAAAVIGVIVSAYVTDWLPGGDGDEASPSPSASATPSRPAVPDSRLVSAERVGSYLVEADGSAEGATDALGEPTTRNAEGTECTMTWEGQVIMEFSNFGGADPCLYGRFCTAQVIGRDWSTAEGLQPGMPTRRMLELYPNAEKVDEPGEITRYVLDPGIEPCGLDAEGGLEAWTNVGRVFALRVTFQAGGD
jgi:hypothetical protein